MAWGIALVIMLGGGATAVIASFPNLLYRIVPPSEGNIEERMRDGDPQGAGRPYAVNATLVDFEGHNTTVHARVHPSEGRSRIDLDDRWRQDEGTQYVIRALVNGTWHTELYRTYVPLTNPMTLHYPAAWDVTSHVARTYTGIDPTDRDPLTFELKVDGRGRFEHLLVWKNGTMWPETFDYSYDDVDIPAFPEGVVRGYCDLGAPQLPRADFGTRPVEPADWGEGILTIPIRMQDVVRPDELEFRFVSANGSLLLSVPWEAGHHAADYFFEWTDANHDSFVDNGDQYRFTGPPEVAKVRIFDEWASLHMDERPRLFLPGPPAVTVVLVLLGWTVLAARRPRGRGGPAASAS